MAPRICRSSVLGCSVEAAVKRQKRLQNKKSFMRVGILLLESSSIQCKVAKSGNRAARCGLTHVFFDARRVHGGSTLIKFGCDLAQPVQLRAKLFDHEFDHPDSFMKRMAYFLFNSAQGSFFAGEFTLEKFLPPLDLFADYVRRCLPG